MSLITQLVGFGLRQVIGDSADDVAQVIGAIEQRFRDHSRTRRKSPALLTGNGKLQVCIGLWYKNRDNTSFRS